jgi:hypothetical protein
MSGSIVCSVLIEHFSRILFCTERLHTVISQIIGAGIVDIVGQLPIRTVPLFDKSQKLSSQLTDVIVLLRR